MLAQIENSKLISSYLTLKQECDVEKKMVDRDPAVPQHHNPDI